MMVGTLAVLDAYYPGGLFTLFATGTGPNARRRGLRAHHGVHHADDVPALQRLQLPLDLAQRLLCTHVLVIYVPFLQTAFHTVPLSSLD